MTLVGSLASPDNSQDDLQISLQKWMFVLDKTELVDFLAFCGRRLSGGSHVRHQQCLALLHVIGQDPNAEDVTRQTAQNWLSGASEPRWRSIWTILYATRATYESDDDMRSDFFGGV